MAFWRQLRLLLWKNYILQKRQKVWFFIQLLWPVFLFAILAIVRTREQGIHISECHFDGKPMPSAGPLPFLQGFVCTVNNTCHDTMTPNERPGVVQQFNTAIIWRVFEEVEKILGNETQVNALSILIDDMITIQKLSELAQNGDLDCVVSMGNSVLNVSRLQEDVTRDQLPITSDDILELGNATLNASDLLIFVNEIGVVPADEIRDQTREMLCNNDEESLLILSNKTRQHELVETLCNMTDSEFATFLLDVQDSVDVFDVLEQLSVCAEESEVGKPLTYNQDTMNDHLNIAADIATAESVADLMNEINSTLLVSLRDLDLNSTNNISAMLNTFNKLMCGRDGQIFEEQENVESFINENDEPADVDPNKYGDTTPFCRDLFSQFRKNTQTGIIWNMIEPIVRGYIPYSPNTPVVNRVIKEANTTFEFLGNFKNLAVQWLALDINATSLAKTGERLVTFAHYNNLASSITNTTDWERIGDVTEWESVIEFVNEFMNITEKLLECVVLDKFEPHESEYDVNKYAAIHQRDDSNSSLWAALIFDVENESANKLPTHVKYSIRMDTSMSDSTQQNKVTDRYYRPGPRYRPLPDMKYLVYGFAYIQDMIEHAIITEQTGKEQEIGIVGQQFPYPCYIDDKFIKAISMTMPFFMVIAWVFNLALLVKSIVYEKEMRLREVMHIMGLNRGVHWVAWFITALILMTMSCLILVFVLKVGGVLGYSDPFLIFLYLQCFILATIAQAFLISVFFSKANLGAVCAAFIFYMSYLPYSLCVRYAEYMSSSDRAGVSILSPVAFGIGCQHLSRYEEQAVGLQWSNIAHSPLNNDSYSVLGCMCMMLFDTFLYMLLTWYIEAVWPGQYGMPKPFYFPFLPSYWCGKKELMTGQLSHELQYQRQEDSNHEKEPSTIPLGVSICGMSKTYKKQKRPAVDNLNLNFYQGQITSLLGHNGAGKTTTMSVLTGLFPPSNGTAKVYGLDIRTHIDDIRKIVGMCPQHNVLYDRLTVEEHMLFYGQLKGMDKKQLEREIPQMVADVELPHKRHSETRTLSGGMKRKLSIAMAFVADSKVVILDEPTAGVDPYARRSIWDLLCKYKKDCTIILSTHFMDEADLLGDRIAILNQGQLKCSGSSLFLKSRFGTGYHLTLVNDKDSNLSNSQAASVKDVTIDAESTPDADTADNHPTSKSESPADSISDLSHTSYVTNFIQRYIPGAKLEEDIGTEYTYEIPQDALDDSTLDRLLQELDNNLRQLEVSSYGVSDTSLEEVFLKVANDSEEPMGEEKTRQTMERVTEGGRFPRPVTRLSFRRKLNTFLGTDKKNDEGILVKDDHLTVDTEDVAIEDAELSRSAEISKGQGSYQTSGLTHLIQQFVGLWAKRFHHFRRSKKAFGAEVLLPAIFVCLGMIFSVLHPSESQEPPLELHPWHLVPNQRAYDDSHLHVFYSNDMKNLSWTRAVEGQLLHEPSISTRCMNEDVYTIHNYHCSPVDDNSGGWLAGTQTKSLNCSCRSGVQQCPEDAVSKPNKRLLSTTDELHDLTGRDIPEWLLKTYPQYRMNRYGGLSFGELDLMGQPNYTTIDNSIERLYNAARGTTNPDIINSSAVLPEYLTSIEDLLHTAVTRQNAKVWFNNKGYISLVSYMNVMNNLILRANLPSNADPKDYGITAVNHPLNRTHEQLEDYIMEQGFLDVMVAISVIFAMSFVPAAFVLFLIDERTSKSKHLQLVSGVKPVVYWIANYTWDMVNYALVAFLCILLFLIFQQDAYVSTQNLPTLILLMLLYGFAVTPLMYPASFVFEIPSLAFVVLACINFLLGLVSTISTYILEILGQDDPDLNDINEILMKVFLVLPHYCLGRGLIDMTRNQIKATVLEQLGIKSWVSPLTWDLVGRNVFFLVIEGCIFFAITLIIQYWSTISHYMPWKTKESDMVSNPADDHQDDVDVTKEKQRVISGDTNNDILVLKHLSKVYGTSSNNARAVDDLTFGIHKGECFGLLGVNGAGKTTTFKMLAGDTSVTNGDAVLDGFSILSDLPQVHQRIGYCPQFDALCPMMTAREHLYLYSRLRGIPNIEIPGVVEWAISKLGLMQHADKCAGLYSGGNKRKLSTAIALLGNPPIIFLDEPTTGMDPKARRFLWDVINQIVRDGRSVVLTSHSMEECEALCNRLAVMVNGTFRCLGSVQHLKNRFGQGYTVTIRVGGDNVDIQPVISFIEQAFPGAMQQELHHNMVQYQLVNTLPVAQIFQTIKNVKEKLDIEDYSVCQTTLDQVFILFAKQQKDLLIQETSGKSAVTRFLHSVKDKLRQGKLNSSSPSLDSCQLSSHQNQNRESVMVPSMSIHSKNSSKNENYSMC